MGPIRIETMKDKLSRLNETINFIEDILEKDKRSDKELIEDKTVYYAIQHMMQICIEIILDVGGHILAEEFKISSSDYKSIIKNLGDKGIIEKDFAEAQEKMASFRNVLVHDYDKIDDLQTIFYAREAPVIFRKFGEAFLKAIKR